MLSHRLFAVLAVAFSLGITGTAAAQSAGPPSNPDYGGQNPSNNADPLAANATRDTAPSRLRRRAAAEPTPEQNKAAAQALLATAGVTTCQISEAALLGVTTADQKPTYETICAAGPGYLVVASEPPQTFSCLELASTAVALRERDPAADVGQQCTLAANLNPTPIVAAYAREAGLACTVDEGLVIGKNGQNLIYEVGCSDGTGYWLEKQPQAWVTTPCYDLVLQDDRCRFSTAAEIAGVWKGMLADTPAASCDVAQARRVGRDAQGLGVYEVKCGGGEGYFARIDAQQHKAMRAQTCAEAANVAGGCTLTTAAPAAAAPAAPAAPTTQQ